MKARFSAHFTMPRQPGSRTKKVRTIRGEARTDSQCSLSDAVLSAVLSIVNEERTQSPAPENLNQAESLVIRASLRK